MKNNNTIILCIIALWLSFIPTAKAAQQPVSSAKAQSPTPAAQNPATQPQMIDYANCNKIFNMDSQKLFYLTLSSINANRFSIDEIQSKSGYITFNVWQRQFLASVIFIDSSNSMLKITPCNNNYYFPIGIVQNIFKYIELNSTTPIEKLTVN